MSYPVELNLDDGRIRYLFDKDKCLEKLIHAIGPLNVTEHNDEFVFIVCEIIGQMLSNRVADVMIERLSMKYDGHITVESVKNVGFDGLKTIGISTAKATYIQNVLAAVESGELNFDDLRDKDDNAVIRKLKRIKDIGNWTAKMYLLFVLGRDNVLPYEDGAFYKAINGYITRWT